MKHSKQTQHQKPRDHKLFCSNETKKHYRPRKDLVKFAKEYRTISPSKLKGIILAKRNKEVTAESVTMWFRRHQDIHQQLRDEIHEEELPEIEVSESIFENGTFEELPSIKNWRLQLDARELAPGHIRQKVCNLKRLCLGRSHGFDFVEEGEWCLKHPDRLTLKDVMQFISLLKAKGKDTYAFKREGKDFLQSKGIGVGKRIAVGKPKGYGKYAELFVEKPTLNKMLSWIKQQNFEIYVIDEFMYKTGTRINATLNALIQDLHEVADKAIQKVYDKGRRSKYPKGHPWKKRIDFQLLWDMKQLIGDRKHGKIFRASYESVAKLNRVVLEIYTPDIFKQYPDLKVNHFWRHMFFQHMLRKTRWNYTIAAALGGSTSESVEESYGKPPEQEIKQWSERFYIKI